MKKRMNNKTKIITVVVIILGKVSISGSNMSVMFQCEFRDLQPINFGFYF